MGGGGGGGVPNYLEYGCQGQSSWEKERWCLKKKLRVVGYTKAINIEAGSDICGEEGDNSFGLLVLGQEVPEYLCWWGIGYSRAGYW